MSDLIELWTDFNAIDRHGHAIGIREYKPLVLDQRVLLKDSDGNTVEGIVVRLRTGLAYVEMDMSTWRSATGS